MVLKKDLLKRGLSNREVEVAKLVAEGISNKQVAEKLFVTEKTIKFHLTNIYRKMGFKSRSQLIIYCLPQMNFVEAEVTAAKPIAENAEKFVDERGELILPKSAI